jgi:hypothetical protein
MKPVKSIVTVADLFGEEPISVEEIRLTVPGKTAAGRIRAVFAGLIHQGEPPPEEPHDDQGEEVKEETSDDKGSEKETSTKHHKAHQKKGDKSK